MIPYLKSITIIIGRIISNTLKFLFLVLLISCIQEKEERYDNLKTSYYDTGEVESIRRWNNNNKDEIITSFSKKGDTTSYIEIKGFYQEVINYYTDSTLYKYYLLGGDNNYWITEYLLLDKNGLPLQNQSEYILVKSSNDSVSFNALTSYLQNLDIVLFEANDSTGTSGDTIKPANGNIIRIADEKIKNKKIMAVTYKHGFPGNDSITISRNIFFNLPIKLYFQKRMKLSSYKEIG